MRFKHLRFLVLALCVVLYLPVAAQHGDWEMPEHGDQLYWFVMADQLEWSAGKEDTLNWDVEGWLGGDFNRVWLKTEGEAAGDAEGHYEIQGLYSRLVTPFWELQAGVRYDRDVHGSQSRAHLVLGLQGLAPYWFHLEPAIFLSNDGDLTARFEGTYDLLLTQRLVLQPALEANFAAQTNADWHEGPGLADIELGLRLRYEFRRELAPYLGIQWEQKFGKTADFARADGVPVARTAFLIGIRAWF
ncbi:MAG: copper resistance protein B [Acidobacteria bacterium]|nr:copper resistance protein B [Acidobacteriota bacterium]